MYASERVLFGTEVRLGVQVTNSMTGMDHVGKLCRLGVWELISSICI